MSTAHQLIRIVGPTATGKTDLAFSMIDQYSQQFAGFDIISADSRQVYRGLELVTGADIPADFTTQKLSTLPYSFWEKDRVRLHGLSCIEIDEEWSVAHFQKLARAVVQPSIAAGRLVIIVGGTGLYHAHLFNDQPRLRIPPDEKVRAQAASQTVTELQEWLKKTDLPRWQSMNQSDRQNPRRLVRAIEVAISHEQPMAVDSHLVKTVRQEWLGLHLPLPLLQQKIAARVKQRWQTGAVGEVEQLMTRYPNFRSLPVASTLGVPEILTHLAGQLSATACQELWALHEFQYAKRQITWWKKQPEVNWLDSPA